MRHVISAPVPGAAPTPQWDEYEDFARKALAALTFGDAPECVTMSVQLAAARFEEFDYTGHGFYLTISVPGSVGRLPRSGKVVDVWAINSNVSDSDLAKYVGIILYVDEGAIALLEAHGNPDWPRDVRPFEFKYSSTNDGPVEFSDMRNVAAMWSS